MNKKNIEHFDAGEDKNKLRSARPPKLKKVKVVIPDKSNKLCQMILEKIESSRPKLTQDDFMKNIEIVKSSIVELAECSNLLLNNKKEMKSQHIRDCRNAIKNMYRIQMDIREKLEFGKL